MKPFEWQEDVLEDWLGRRSDGRWAAKTCGLAVPRQNGKNALIEVRELFGMVALGEKILHTAHEVKTARKAFLRIASFFENEREYPELAALAKEIRKTNGQEAIVLTNGGSVEFIARSKKSGRGFTVDVLVCDEAQELTDEELAVLKPTTSAAPSGNPQFIVTGTPPDPERITQGEVFRRTRANAVAGRDIRLAWTDYGVADGQLPDIDDPQVWLRHNPSAPELIDLEEIQGEHMAFAPEMFARERLGWWGDPSAASSAAFGAGQWEACADEAVEPVFSALGVAVSFDRLHASIAVAGMDGDRLVVGAVEHREGAGWVVPELLAAQEKHGCAVVVDERGPAADLIPALEAAGVELTLLKTDDVLTAAAAIYERVQDRTIVHPSHPDLDIAVAVASKRPVGGFGEGRWTWARKTSAGDISMLEAATNAAHIGSQPPPDPSAYFI